MRAPDSTKHPRHRWPLVLAASGALLFFVGISTVRETYHRWEVDQEVSSLQTQVEQLERKKLDLSHVVQTLNSPANVDEQARLRLGLQKPGERVFILDGTTPSAPSWKEGVALAPATTTPNVLVDSSASNPKKWLTYFFLTPKS